MEEKIFTERDKNLILSLLKNHCEQTKTLIETISKFGKSTLSLGEWLVKWFQTYKNDVSISTKTHIKICIERHISADLKSLELSSITSQNIQNLLANIKTTRTRLDTFDVLNGAFREAINNEFIFSNPMSKIVRPKHTRQKGKPLSVKNQSQFLRRINNSTYKNYFLTILFTGARPGEALKIKWEDIFTEENKIFINGTKNETSERFLPLFKNLQSVLDKLKISQNGNTMTGRIFKHSYSRAAKDFKTRCAGHSLKDLRHTFSTRSAEAGVSPKVLQQWLGHSKIETTMNIYTHVLSEFERQESERLDKYIDEISSF